MSTTVAIETPTGVTTARDTRVLDDGTVSPGWYT